MRWNCLALVDRSCSKLSLLFLFRPPFVFFYPLIIFSLYPRYIPTTDFKYFELDELPFELVSVRLHRNRSTPQSEYCPIYPTTADPTPCSGRNCPWETPSPGGVWSPKTCKSHFEVVIIVAYRDRPEQLTEFLDYMHPFLQSQYVSYRIVVVEQSLEGYFNRGKLFNAGFSLIQHSKNPTECFIFHDVDMFPEDNRNIYACSHQPRHMSVATNTLRYQLLYPDLFGGVTALTASQFVKLNGYTNRFSGWGGEDDEMSKQLQHYGFSITRLSPKYARYRMLGHPKAKGFPNRNKLILNWDTEIAASRKIEGLNSLRFVRLKTEERALYTWYLVDVCSGRLNCDDDVPKVEV